MEPRLNAWSRLTSHFHFMIALLLSY